MGGHEEKNLQIKERGMIGNVDESRGASSHRPDVTVALCGALSVETHQHPMRLPWEMNPTLKRVFENDLMPWLSPCKIPRGLPTTSPFDKRLLAITSGDKIKQ